MLEALLTHPVTLDTDGPYPPITLLYPSIMSPAPLAGIMCSLANDLYILGGGAGIENSYKYDTLTKLATKIKGPWYGSGKGVRNGQGVVVGEYLYIVGGILTSAFTKNIYKYHLPTDTVEIIGQTPNNFTNATIQHHAGILYTFFGELDGGYANIIARYSLLTNTWLPPITLDAGRSFSVTCAKDGILYFGGGVTTKPSYGYPKDFFKYDTSTGIITQLAPLPTNVYSVPNAPIIMGIDDFTIVGIQNQTSEVYLKSRYTYNILTDTWGVSAVPTDPVTRNALTAITANGFLYVFLPYGSTGQLYTLTEMKVK